MMPCPTVTQTRAPSSAVVTKSLSLEHQVGEMPGLPKATSSVAVKLAELSELGDMVGPDCVVLAD
jgi:hypothetical protein